MTQAEIKQGALEQEQGRSMARLAEILEGEGIHVHQVLEQGAGWYPDDLPCTVDLSG